MLTFRNTNIVFLLLLAVLIWLHINHSVPFYSYILLFIVYSLIVFYGCAYINSNFFLPVICHAVTTEKEIAISFDDGPAQNYTAQILKVLQENDCKAAFFCIGKNIAGNEHLLKQIIAEGHLIGNHSYSHHFWFDLFSSKRILTDLRSMDEEVKRVAGLQPILFRPPYGVINPNVKKAIVDGQYIPLGWSVRSLDTVIMDEQKLLDKINGSIQPGAVFLFHDTSLTTLKVLPQFLKEVKKKGYRIVPLDKLLHLEPYA